MIEPLQFEGQTASAIFNRASAAAVQGAFLSEYKDPELGDLSLVVVAKFAPDRQHERDTAMTVFRKHQVPMYTFDALEPLIADIRQRSH